MGHACVVAFALGLFSRAGLAATPSADAVPIASKLEPKKDVSSAPSKDRYELAGLPILGGNSDIGFQIGGAATWTRFYGDAQPYLWNVDLLLSASAKNDQNGFRLVQQSHVLRLDMPGLFGGRLRIDARGTFTRTINAGYYGVGNAATAAPPADDAPNAGRRYQYIQQEGWLRAIGRVRTPSPFDFAFAINLRFEAPNAYGSSKLADDLGAADPVVGSQAALVSTLTAGAVLDTRDSEFITRRGVFYQLGLAGSVGTAENVAYGETSLILAHYAPLPGPFIFASRVFVSLRFGRLPFYDLQQGGAFEPESLLGGDSGVRGVPQGRYAGLIKAITNLELRSTPFPRVKVLGQNLLVGTTTFVDAGRVWSEYRTISAADGTSLGLKYGIGGGLFVQWGEAAIFRIEAAYSPDAVSENSSLPIGFYISDGLMF